MPSSLPTDLMDMVRAEIERMRGAIAHADPQSEVRMRAGQFGQLADFMEVLIDRVSAMPEATAQDDEDEDGMGDPRYWVPLDHFQRIKADADHWRAEHGRLQHSDGDRFTLPF